MLGPCARKKEINDNHTVYVVSSTRNLLLLLLHTAILGYSSSMAGVRQSNPR